MDLLTILGSTIILGLSVIAVLGWSHRRLSDRLDQLEKELMLRPKEDSIKSLILDKLAPHSVELKLLESRLDEIRNDQKEFDKKLDKIIALFNKK